MGLLVYLVVALLLLTQHSKIVRVLTASNYQVSELIALF